MFYISNDWRQPEIGIPVEPAAVLRQPADEADAVSAADTVDDTAA